MTDLIDRIRAYAAAHQTHRCDGCELDFTSETMTCPSCGIADRTRWVADSEANRLLREVAALEPVAHVADVFLPKNHYNKDADVIEGLLWKNPHKDRTPLYTLTGDSHD